MFFPGVKYQNVPVEWPDLVGIGAPQHLLCLFNRNDQLFSINGQMEADRRLRRVYSHLGHAAHYTSESFQGGHKFDREMQQYAAEWLQETLHG